eukprot:TRINITY_DN109262_c0_g1_i1.p1 TRINITY_DN109262_c0_g1~~TRINITY_DN109262_c0_g1_i1.p1  ORF type:complete len:340 (+),score=43.76 TRINITY_DN109262_c0_g1_i1:207-1226(+)
MNEPLERRSWLANWGPDTLAATCRCCGWTAWIGIAKLSSLAPAPASGPEECESHVKPSTASSDASSGPVELWHLLLAYDGTDFAGWQKQSEGVRTIQGEVDKALSLVFRTDIRTVGSSRTDSGVHARGQVCHFEAPKSWAGGGSLDSETALRRLRLTLPPAILAVHLARAPPNFHSRLSAVKKRYSYRLSLTDAISPFDARTCWRCGRLDLDAVKKAAGLLNGRHLNYAAFTMGDIEPDYHGSVEKTVELAVQHDNPDRVLVLAVCDRFLFRMVRRIVGALVEVGKGRIEPSSIASAERSQVPTAPPEGLFLDEVVYPGALGQGLVRGNIRGLEASQWT